jgi:hypothetical protein
LATLRFYRCHFVVSAYDKAHIRTLSFAFEIKRVLTRKRPWGRACQNG